MIRDAIDANATGNYLCCECGVAYRKYENAVRHENVVHLQDDTYVLSFNDATDIVADGDLEERWLIIYDETSMIWEHPKQVEGKKRRIRALQDADYYLNLVELLERVWLPAEAFEHPSWD